MGESGSRRATRPVLTQNRFDAWVSTPFRRLVLSFSVAAVTASSRAQAHGISEESRETMTDGGILDYIWLGAEHMVTGYDHLLFLFGVIFFLAGFRDIVRFITAFTLGHCITLLGATLAGITANAYLIDAVIALSVIYKGFENLDGFKKLLEIKAPNLLSMVFLFGLVHGFGLSTRLQELPLGEDGLVLRILAFNLGVELGQIAALAVMLVGFAAWRSRPSFERFANTSNTALVLAGVGLFFFQMNGYFEDAHHRAEEAAHGHAHEDERGHAHEGAAHGQDGDGHGHEAEKPAAHGHAHGEHGHGQEGDGHGHEAEKPAAHGHAHGEHGHGHEAEKPAAHGHTHDGDGHGHEAEKPAAHGHAHGEHGHGHEVKSQPEEAEKPKGHDHGEHGHDHGVHGHDHDEAHHH
jgi:hypothetical protein